VHHNGQFLPARFETLAEVALGKGYATSFFSGGPPIWRKSGLNQGFETFDDNVPIKMHLYHRTVQQDFKLFLDWLENVKNQPYFSVIYVPDLQFPNSPTVDTSGEMRELSLQSQETAVDEALDYLFRQLKQNHRWDNT